MNMETHEEPGVILPEKISNLVIEILQPDERVRNVIATDITLDGIYAESWLLVTDKRLITFNPIKEGETDYVLGLEVSFEDIKEVKIDHFPGNGLIKLVICDGTIELLRFSRTLAQRMESLSKEINKLVKGDLEVEDDKVSSMHKNSKHDTEVIECRCKKCGRLISEETEVCSKCLEKRKVLFRLARYLKPYLPLAFLSFFLTLGLTALQLTPPFLTKLMVDEAIGKGDLGKLTTIIWGIIVVYLSLAVVNGFRTYLMQWLGQHIVFDIRSQLYQHLQALSLSFFDKRRTGEIMSRVSSDTMRLRQFLVNGAQEIIIEILTIIGIGAIMFAINWKLALFALIPAPIIFFGTVNFSKRIHKIYRKVWRRMAAMNALLGDTIPGIRVVKAFGKEEDEVERFTERNMEVFVENVNAARLQSNFFPMMSLATSIGSAVVWGWGGYLVMRGSTDLTIGDLVAFISYMTRFYVPVRMLSQMSSTIQTATTSAERIFEILDVLPEGSHKDAKDMPPIKGEIEFKDVKYDKAILN
jgi:ATP-binding cassette subfamily B protein